jgi:isoquinoline 1-oxidoreductase
MTIADSPAAVDGSGGQPATVLRVNGTARSVPADGSLLSALRESLGLTGAKPGCGEGACGACAVLVDGSPVRACQQRAASVAGREIITIEGLAAGGPLHYVQQAFVDEGAAQCGYCTPGMVLSAAALLAADSDPDDAAIDDALAGQICRCGCYPAIRRAIRRAARLAGSRADGRPGTDGGDGQAGGDGRQGEGGHDAAGQADRLAPAEPGAPRYRPSRPWDLTEPADRDWFSLLGDGLVVVVPPPEPGIGGWSTSSGAWLHVTADGLVTAFTGKVDVGQDNRTALRQLVAEELGVPLARVALVLGDTDLCPFDMGTFGSRSMPDAGGALRRAAASARALLPVRAGSRRIEIAADAPALRSATAWQVAGEPVLAPGTLDAVTGARRFVADVRLPVMGHGAVLQPPIPGAVLRRLDTSGVGGLAGIQLISTQALTGIVADDAQAARRALADLQAAATWELPDAPSDSGIGEFLRSHPAQSTPAWGGAFHHTEGDPDAALAGAAACCAASYRAAYIAAAPLENRAALAVWDDDGRLTVWTGTQTPFPVRAQVAAALGLGESDVRIVVPPTGGGFGGKHAADVAIEAAICAREAGRPVRVAWTRHEEFTKGTLRPAAVIDVAAGVNGAGELVAWTFLNVNSGQAGIGMPYLVPNLRLDYAPAASPLPQASYRALAATANNFARECHVDELAARLGQDPVQFRLRNLADQRLADVLQAAADRAGWVTRPRGARRDQAAENAGPELSEGLGIACGLEKEGRVATAARVEIGPGGSLRVSALVIAYDCGAVVNPATVTSQIEGAAVMALGGALFEAIRFTDGAISNGTLSAYRVPRLADIPPIEVILLDRRDQPPAGAGETPMIAVAPAIANAIFDATGRRYRDLPLTDDGVLRSPA